MPNLLNRKTDLHAERRRVFDRLARAQADRDAAAVTVGSASDAWREAMLQDAADVDRKAIARRRAADRLADASNAVDELQRVLTDLDARIAAELARERYAEARRAFDRAAQARETASDALPTDVERAIEVALAAFGSLRDQVAAFDQAVQAERNAHDQLVDLADRAGEPAPIVLSADPYEAVMRGLPDGPARELFQASRHRQRRVTLEVAARVMFARQDGVHVRFTATNLATPPTQTFVRGPKNDANQLILGGAGEHGLNRPPLIH